MKRALVAIAIGTGVVVTVSACFTQRGGDAIPLDRRYFHEVPPPDTTFAQRPDAAPEEDAAPDAKPAPKPQRADGGKPWEAPRSGYLEYLGSEFKRLRPMPMTEYDVHHTKGRKRWVMNELSRHLIRASRDTVLRIMGPPDSAVRPGDSRWGPTNKQEGRAVERLLYQWRGWKDYLLFELDSGGNVYRSQWSLSTE
jgi:hypothetical protein